MTPTRGRKRDRFAFSRARHLLALFLESNTPTDELMEERDMADCLVMLAFTAKSKTDEFDGDSALLDWKNHDDDDARASAH